MLFSSIQPKACIVSLASSAFLAFGLYHVHSFSGITEGGVLGMTLLLYQWLQLSPAISGCIMNLACYLMGWKLLGKKFMVYSLISTLGFSAAYKICEQFPPLWPQLVQFPLLASVVGALFVGIGAGVCVRMGGAPGGDDALAMSLSHLTHIKIQWMYLLTDIIVLALSLSYIPFSKMVYSLLTVVLSGQIIGWIQQVSFPKKDAD